MSEEVYQHKLKYKQLLKELSGYGYSESNKISQSEIILFLDLRTPKKKFDRNLSTQLFKILDISEKKIISIEQFINGFLEFEKEINNNYETLKSEYLHKNDQYQNLISQCKRYQNEVLNNEGFSEDGKLFGKIIDINLKKKLEGVKEIIIKINFGEQNAEVKQKLINQIEIVKDDSNKSFEFKADSKKNNIEFILQAKNDLGHIYNIGNQIYSLENIDKQEEFSDEIEIKENNNNNDDNLFAVIKFEMTLIWSYFKLYDLKRSIEEPTFQKMKKDYEDAEKNLKMLKRVYCEEGEEFEQSDINDNKNEIKVEDNPKLRNDDRDKPKYVIEEGFSEKKLFEFPKYKYVVEFNNIRIDKAINKDLDVNINNKLCDSIQNESNLSNNKEDEKNKENNEVVENKENVEQKEKAEFEIESKDKEENIEKKEEEKKENDEEIEKKNLEETKKNEEDNVNMVENNIKIEDRNEDEDEEPKDRNEEDPNIMEIIKANEQKQIIDEKINQKENPDNNANTNENLNSLPLQQNAQQEQEKIDNYNINSGQNTNPLNQKSKVPAKILSVKYHSVVLNNKMNSSPEATSQNNISSSKMQEYNNNNFNNFYRVNPMNDAATKSYQTPTNINQQYQHQYQYGF
jgi:hypothetical protein